MFLLLLRKCVCIAMRAVFSFVWDLAAQVPEGCRGAEVPQALRDIGGDVGRGAGL